MEMVEIDGMNAQTILCRQMDACLDWFWNLLNDSQNSVCMELDSFPPIRIVFFIISLKPESRQGNLGRS